ncbi:MAG: DNA gyrase subunit A, partial [Treponemataceae bacterium]|nr:DNA gyrase subunit A [Treponemataceae bacterium]
LRDLLEHHEKILALIKDETNALAEKFGDDRRTDIVADEIEAINVEDMIKEEEMVIMISKLGYIKRVAVSTYKKQERGGKGSNSTSLLEDDYVNQLFIGSTHDHLLFITTLGRAYWIKVHEIPESSKASRGAHIKSMIAIGADEEITTVVSLKEFTDDVYLFMTTANGVVKKVQASEFVNAKIRGIIGLKLDSGDKLISAISSTGSSEILLISRRGKALRFSENEVRAMGRASRGIKGLKLSEGDEVAGAVKVEEDESILLLTEKGYGKRVKFEDFKPHGRGTGGQKIFGNIEERGEIIGILTVKDADEVVCMTSQGKTLRAPVNTINQQTTGSSGVKVVTISEPDFLVGVDKIQDKKDS